jgi:crotonobetainyl-CoA:carnitine CoA-transferase CaiB-like acyl-CoA transferase
VAAVKAPRLIVAGSHGDTFSRRKTTQPQDRVAGVVVGKPLEGVRVVDLSQVTSGPLATMVLAEQGADVVKVEPPGLGDVARNVLFQRGGFTSWYLNHNRGKRSIAVSTETIEGRTIVADLMARADVVVQNFRPGVVERLGLGYAAISARNPEVIYVSISGFGPTGPYADRPVLDPIIQAYIGMVAIQKSEAIPFPDVVRNVVVDKSTAFLVAESICAALFHRARTGEGNHIEVPMLDTGLYFLWPDGMMHRTFLGEDAPDGVTVAERIQLTYCADGQLLYWATTDRHRQALLRVLGHAELCDDQRFQFPGITEVENLEAFGTIVVEAFARQKVGEVLRALHAASVPAAPINELEDVFIDPQIRHNHALVTWDHPLAGRLQQPRHPVRFSNAETPVPEMADLLGEHTDEILHEIGRTPEQIHALRAMGVVA